MLETKLDERIKDATLLWDAIPYVKDLLCACHAILGTPSRPKPRGANALVIGATLVFGATLVSGAVERVHSLWGVE